MDILQVKDAPGSPIQQQWVERIVWRSFSYYPRLGKVRRYLEEHMHDKLTLCDAARIASCESKYFSSYFHAKVNVRFTDWVRLVRVAEAARLLRTEDITVYQAARQAGFGNIRALERAFQRFCGVTPGKYKAHARPDEQTVLPLSSLSSRLTSRYERSLAWSGSTRSTMLRP